MPILLDVDNARGSRPTGNNWLYARPGLEGRPRGPAPRREFWSLVRRRRIKSSRSGCAVWGSRWTRSMCLRGSCGKGDGTRSGSPAALDNLSYSVNTSHGTGRGMLASPSRGFRVRRTPILPILATHVSFHIKGLQPVRHSFLQRFPRDG